MMVSRNGSAVSFDESDVRPMGRSAAGVRGMALRAGDEVIALRVPRPDEDLIVVTEQGYGKRTPFDEYPIKGRGTLGVLTVDRQAIARRGQLVGAVTAGTGNDLMVITAGGIVTRQAVGEIRQTGRATQGVIVQKLRDPDDRIAAIAIVREPDAEGDADPDAALVEPPPAVPDVEPDEGSEPTV